MANGTATQTAKATNGKAKADVTTMKGYFQQSIKDDPRPRTKSGRLVKPAGRKEVRMRPGSVAHIQTMIDNHEEFSGMSNETIAGRVGCSVSSVRRVKAELRKQGLYPTTIKERVQAALKTAKMP